MAYKKLSILMPVYNERYYVRQIVHQVLNVPLPRQLERELIIVDDCSTDGTRAVLEDLAREHPEQIRLYFQDQNQGKGAAIRSAIQYATGEISVIQDADLEYDPEDYGNLLRPILEGDADVVFGSRFLTGNYRRVLFYWHSVMNRMLTTLSNIFTDLNLTDMETCYKMCKTSLLKSIPIRSDRFGIEPELTAKFAKRNCRIYEVPISYRGRSYDEGKKITWFDGIKAVFVILYFWILDDIYENRYGHDILHSLSKAQRFNAWMAENVKPWVGESVLEIGAGLGNMSAKLIPRIEYTATDLDPLYLEYLENRFGNYEWMDIRKLDLQCGEDFGGLRNRYDTIVCLNVLEHVPDSDAAVENMYSALKPGGAAIILVPQGKWLFGSLDSVLEHCQRYKREELKDKCKRAGFEIDRIFSFNRVGVWPWFLNSRILRRKRFNRIQLKFFDNMVWLWRRIDRLWPWPGLSLICIARKPLSPESETSAETGREEN
jgi:glycosyltransferase involved in cell wall biosynthesis